ncbi:hypothetical protein V6N13_135817 [Hibiscus sabdariffa]
MVDSSGQGSTIVASSQVQVSSISEFPNLSASFGYVSYVPPAASDSDNAQVPHEEYGHEFETHQSEQVTQSHVHSSFVPLAASDSNNAHVPPEEHDHECCTHQCEQVTQSPVHSSSVAATGSLTADEGQVAGSSNDMHDVEFSRGISGDVPSTLESNLGKDIFAAATELEEHGVLVQNNAGVTSSMEGVCDGLEEISLRQKGLLSMASGIPSDKPNEYPSVEGFDGDGLQGAAGGRPPDTSTNGGGVNALEKDVEMSDNIDTGKRTGYSEPAIMVEKEDDQTTMRLQGSGSQIPSFKEKLIGKSGAERVSELRKPDDLYGPWMQVTNRRRQNANVQGVGGRISGVSRTKEIMGSRFKILASDTLDEDEEITEQQQVGDVRGSRNEWREEGLVSRDRGQGNQDNNGSVEVVRWGGPVVSSISLGVVNGTGTSSANKNASTEVNVGRVETGGVVNAVTSLEKVTMAKSNLNSEKHKAVFVGNTDDSHIPRITKGRVLPNSMRGSVVKPGSRFQLGVKGGASTSLAIKKVAERGLSKADASGRLSRLVSDLDKAAVEEETRVALLQKAAAVDELRVDWQTNSVFEQPSESVRKV